MSLIVKYQTSGPNGESSYTITTCNEVTQKKFANRQTHVFFTTYAVGIAGGVETYETSVVLTPDGPIQTVFVENLAGKVVQKFSA